MTVGLVVVSHSRPLARAAVDLAQEMVHGNQIQITVAAGLDETTFGTDAAEILDAITAADTGDGVVVLMDLGSAVLSAELALELLDDEARARTLLCPAPMVEGLVVAAVAAAGGGSPDEVAAEASGALAGKLAHLGPVSQAPTSDESVGSDELTASFVVANPHGLHARPAARLVGEVRHRDAHVRIRNRRTDSAWVDAGSLSKIATLGVRCGDEVDVRASGTQATESLEHILALATRNFDESAADAAPEPVPVTPHAPIGAGPGLGIGPARSPRLSMVAVPDTPAEDPEAEWHRLGIAIDEVRRTITAVRARTAREVGETEASIFDAHQLLLEDEALLGGARERIDQGHNAAAAWSAAVSGLAAEFAALSDPYLQARAEDVRAVGDQVLRALLGSAAGLQAVSGVLVAGDLTPGEAAELDPQQVSAVLLAFGSPHAHNVILLRAKGIPVVVGAGPTVLTIPDGTTVAVDGGRGAFIVDPPEDIRKDFQTKVEISAQRQRAARARAAEPAVTLDGVTIGVGANIASVDDARAAASYGADFAGLIRTEFLFLGRQQAPDVDEQLAVYRKIAESLDGKRITLRTLDVGGDKPLPFLPTPAEMNPYLGVRGIRLSLAHPTLLSDQLLAVARLAQHTPVSVMFPMISTLDELFAARRLLDEAIGRAGPRPPAGLQVGMMVEVPAAALKSAAFAPHVDFMSIGTNDLTQYALAADRNNDAVATIGDTFDPGLLRLIAETCRGAAGQASISVCGEFAADHRAAALLVGLGVNALSVAPPAIPATKESVRAVDRQQAEATAEKALAADSASAVRKELG
ncbi:MULTISPECIES: phosphoenolpyruvate--protein phosphotransferase [unclassified Mycolicibacterium]|uniref:phosphoenolpyruvate--protein phosphotransferase n=1 Tax=unclassified Mycolicibacterium TaxID=2636767 RepID=UPI00130A9D3E|nr:MULTISPECIES: phosphoenolpyruvate--protein phosphotransferase [unclassified Mycolicibacterium]MUL80839.1 phosphoenolpyruvate--protein phosphotransferase [Mycolicibacterium sp. CBMA 329]MUL86605.1 phosphoenolpyruvate--protein phosphotransferase [Mycolicibacterium sp. CBMA 331]MUM02810.1 phosphoenolpyruvate--protein phosphotransferase [Mycolicibacterium sp. CBMA 334]MUM26302.1 phosphoenolpyruvate--protein phosphotransferase [Mycolicibacterium sp. CBMA 295]MUM36902.1 phosphoenolpyruvate--prote